MKRILIKYLKSNDLAHITETINTQNLQGKSIYEYALAQAPEDTFIAKMAGIADVGVNESIEALKSSSLYFKELKNKLNMIQNSAKVNEDVQVLPTYLNILSENLYEPVFKAEYNSITQKLNENKRTMALSHFYIQLDESGYLSKPINEAKEVLFDLIVENNETNESRFINVAQGLEFNPAIKGTLKYIMHEKSNYELKPNEFVVENVAGVFEQVDESKFVVHTENRNLVIDDVNSTVTDLNEALELSNEFTTIAKLMDKKIISVSEVVNINANKMVSVNDSGQVFVGGKEVALVENNLPYTLLTKYGIDKSYIPTVEHIVEHIDKFVSFDNAQKIQHKQNSSINAVIFRVNESLFAFKTNAKIGTKYITESYSPSELRDDIKEFINFDIKENFEFLEDLFINESQLERRKKEVLAKIEQLEQELEKIENAETEEDLKDDSLDELKEILKTNINELRKEYVSIDEKDLEGWIEATIKGKKDIYYVDALEYTQASKSDELQVKDASGKIFTETKSNIKPEE